MTRSSEEEPQRTVAELLAQHGAKPDAPRRRRRRAEGDDDADQDLTQTGPQAIIDRVAGHTPPPANRPSGGRRAKPEPADNPPQQPSQGMPLPPRPGFGAQNDRPQNELPQRPPRGRRPAGNGGSGYFAGPSGSLSSRLDGPDAPPAGPVNGSPNGAGESTGYFPPPQPGQQPSGSFGVPPRPLRRPARRQPPPEPNTEQFPAVESRLPAEPLDAPETEGPGDTPAGLAPGAPPAGLARWRKRREKSLTEDTEVGIEPIDPAAVRPPGQQPPARGEQTAVNAPVRSAFEEPAEDYEDEPHPDDFHSASAVDTDEADTEDDYDYDEADLDEDYEQDESPGKQWATMGVQLAAGVVGGAAVWLGFNWLWGQLPAAALIAAVVVIAGLVWIVRKIRRAEDLQTTVLALLVGLVVTVSPAALLLVAR
ncbi:hypothetical protein CFN78_00415 [Amycolatopsis antarctica]|uniref:Uncharacterized protein n=1 Tax=Amycolatopsis antarctica TaxID=1854586 RepID=A0A263D8C8_9PSEU|nr:hypothetical protein [Amycolatopsis antarctica]OZM74740.1 hypothetical protein CFN78_00415 [Amycolatopsis antarctica]